MIYTDIFDVLRLLAGLERAEQARRQVVEILPDLIAAARLVPQLDNSFSPRTLSTAVCVDRDHVIGFGTLSEPDDMAEAVSGDAGELENPEDTPKELSVSVDESPEEEDEEEATATAVHQFMKGVQLKYTFFTEEREGARSWASRIATFAEILGRTESLIATAETTLALFKRESPLSLRWGAAFRESFTERVGALLDIEDMEGAREAASTIVEEECKAVLQSIELEGGSPEVELGLCGITVMQIGQLEDLAFDVLLAIAMTTTGPDSMAWRDLYEEFLEALSRCFDDIRGRAYLID